MEQKRNYFLLQENVDILSFDLLAARSANFVVEQNLDAHFKVRFSGRDSRESNTTACGCKLDAQIGSPMKNPSTKLVSLWRWIEYARIFKILTLHLSDEASKTLLISM